MASLVLRILRISTMFLFLATVALLFAGQGAPADLTMYGNSLADGWYNWSWDTAVNFSNTTLVNSTPYSISVTFNKAWAGLYLHADPPIDTSGYSQFSFYINGGATGNQKLRVVLNGDDSSAYMVTAPVNPPDNKWTQVSVPLSALGGPASISDIYWQDTNGGAQPTFYLDDITLVAGSTPPVPPSAGPDLSINAASGQHPISADIYGMNYADEQLAAELRLPVRRWGGNSTSRYNWQNDTLNTGSDWYFENISEDNENPAALPDGSGADKFVEQDRRTETKTLMTVPLIGWTPKRRVENHPYDCGFKVSKYGAQQSVDSWDTDCGNGVYSSGSNIAGNDPTDTSIAIDTTFVTGWLNHLTGKYGTATNGGIIYYDLDNEPMLWNSTHRDVHPQPVTYDELRDRTYQYAAAVKGADPSARTLGPVLWGWCAYFYSAFDGCGIGSDYNSHNSTYFVPWYLQQMKAYEDQHGVRILDYLDLHNYPQANGVALSSAGNASTQALRLRSTRSLWDATYVDESWIASMGLDGGVVKLIPRMKNWVNTYYPGTKLAITEYNWGGLESINGALAQADVLGIFGREGMDLATLWGPPSSNQPGAYAFRIYRNYDGSGSAFGETGVQAASDDQDKLAVYVAKRSSDNALTVVVINKTTGTLTSNISLAGIAPQPSASVYRYSSANLSAIEHLTDQAVTASGFSTSFPGYSITLFAIKGNMAIPDDFNGDGKPDLIWRNISNGQKAVWYMDGVTRTGSGFLPNLSDKDWQTVGISDINGDGKPDLIWRNTVTGENAVWYMDGIMRNGSAYLPPMYDQNWQIVDVSDINGDGKPDLIWRNYFNGQNAVWYMDGVTRTGSAFFPGLPDQNWRIAGLNDFNGDGKPDLVWRNSSNGQNAVWYMDGVTRTGSAFLPPMYDPNWKLAGTGDFNNDGKPDLIWRNTANGQNAVWYMDGITRTGSDFFPALPDQNWQIVGR